MERYRRDSARWRMLFGLGYLVFLLFPIAAELRSRHSPTAKAGAMAGLAAFVALDIRFWVRVHNRTHRTREAAELIAALVAIATALTLQLGGGTFIYCGVNAAAAFRERRSALALGAVGALALVVLLLARVPVAVVLVLLAIMVLGGVGTLGVTRLVRQNVELQQAREEVARLAVTEERLRFARDLHDLLGHSLSVIVLKSELAGRLAEAAPDRAGGRSATSNAWPGRRCVRFERLSVAIASPVSAMS